MRCIDDDADTAQACKGARQRFGRQAKPSGDQDFVVGQRDRAMPLLCQRQRREKFGDPLHRFSAVTVSACNLRPTSRGVVQALSREPRTAPRIAPNYLATEADRLVAADAIRLTRSLMRQPALAAFRPTEELPGQAVGDDPAELAIAAGNIGTTIFHPVGTARMKGSARRRPRLAPSAVDSVVFGPGVKLIAIAKLSRAASSSADMDAV